MVMGLLIPCARHFWINKISRLSSDDDLITLNDFASIINRIQARCGLESTEILADI